MPVLSYLHEHYVNKIMNYTNFRRRFDENKEETTMLIINSVPFFYVFSLPIPVLKLHNVIYFFE